MRRNNVCSFYFFSFFLLPMLILSGCVAESKYLAQVAETESTKTALQDEMKKNAALNERVSSLSNQLAEQKAKIEKLDSEKADAARKIDELSSIINGLNSDLERAKETAKGEVGKSMAEIERISAERDEARKRAEGLSSEVDQLRSKEKEAQEKIARLSSEIDQLRSDFAAEKMEKDGLKGKIEGLKLEVADLTSKLAEKADAARKIDELSATINGLNRELEMAREAVKGDAGKSMAEIERISAERDEARKRVEGLSSEIDQLRSNEKEAQEKIARLLSEIDGLRSGSTSEKMENEELRGKIDSLKNQIARLEEEKKVAEKRIAELESKTGNILSEAERAAAEAKRKEKELEETRLTYESLLGKLKKEVEEGNIKVEMLKKGLSLKIMEKILFDSGSDKISNSGKELLDRLSAVLKDVKDREIRIEGHTDNKPIGPTLIDKFPTNWDLSTSRASQVVKYLSKGGVDPNVMSAAGYSMYHPVSSNDTKEGREQNRRIEVILYPKELSKTE